MVDVATGDGGRWGDEEAHLRRRAVLFCMGELYGESWVREVSSE